MSAHLGEDYIPLKKADAPTGMEWTDIHEPVNTISELQAVPTSGLFGGETVTVLGIGRYQWNPDDRYDCVLADEVTRSQGDGRIFPAPASDRTGMSGSWEMMYAL